MLDTTTAPDGRTAPIMRNGIVVAKLRKLGTLVATTDTHEFYVGRTKHDLIAVEVAR